MAPRDGGWDGDDEEWPVGLVSVARASWTGHDRRFPAEPVLSDPAATRRRPAALGTETRFDRLVDDFQAELMRRNQPLPGELRIVGLFGDLDWQPHDFSLVRYESDPAFIVIGYSRWMAFARIFDEIRFYAANLGVYGDLGPFDATRRAAILAEDHSSEINILRSVADAVTLTVSFLGGTSLGDIPVTRIPPPWRRQE